MAGAKLFQNSLNQKIEYHFYHINILKVKQRVINKGKTSLILTKFI